MQDRDWTHHRHEEHDLSLPAWDSPENPAVAPIRSFVGWLLYSTLLLLINVFGLISVAYASELLPEGVLSVIIPLVSIVVVIAASRAVARILLVKLFQLFSATPAGQ